MHRSLLFLLMLAVAACGRPAVDDLQARALLAQAEALVQAGRLDELCGLSQLRGGVSTCADSLEQARELAPVALPTVVCSLPLPATGPLRNGRILVLEGADGAGEPYRSEFPVFHDGDAIKTIDAVYWGGLSLQTYGETTMSWRFDSASDLCTTRALPGEGAEPVPLPTA